MVNKITSIKERIVQYLDFKGLVKEHFFSSIGVTSANFRGKAQETPLNSTAIENIITKYPDINLNWLITGKGEMLQVAKAQQVMNEPQSEYTSPPKGFPLLSFDAFGGNGDDSAMGISFSAIEDRYVVPLFEGVHIDFMIPVRGSSMYPKYNSGDVVACRLIKDLQYIQWNKSYVIDTYSQGTILKRLKKSTTDERVVCKSDNKDYDDFDLPKKDIRNIAIVVGVIRLE